MEKWSRIKYMPCLPLGDNRSRVTGCEKHIQLAREAAQEGIVLLKNNNSTLPLQKGARVAIFGTAQIDYIKGGGGSGVVYCEYTRNIYEGLKQKSQIEVYDPLSLFYEARVSDAIRNGELEGRNTSVARKLGYLKGNITEAKIPEDLLAGAKAFTDTAIITICRYSAEYFDRYADGSDPYFELSPEEALMVETVCNNFDKVIVLLNTGAMIESAWFAQNDKVDAALMVWQGGMEGGLAVADVLVGEVTPSGKLVDTCAKSFGDYPSSAGFHESPDYVKYEEDIFVGYRYFETIPGMAGRVVYPFGFGLSYTAFEISNVSATALGGEILVSADVQNVGAYAGKEVVQVYYAAPEGKLTKAARSLCAFAKMRLLAPGERQTLTMRFEIAAMASYDDLGVVQKSAYVLEAGAYRFFVGNSVRDAKEIAYKYVLEGDKVTEQLTAYCTPTSLEKRLTATGAYVDVPATSRVPESFPCTAPAAVILISTLMPVLGVKSLAMRLSNTVS
jgi:beta-glucosidase